jgi:D-amino-acid dehydrogenase
MKVIVVGSGLIGVTTAYFLQLSGHAVTVIERCDGPGRETSFANGSLLTPSMSDPWNAPGCWRVLLASLARSDAPLQLRLRALPTLAGWGATFLRNSRAAAYERNTLRNLRLALYSREVMHSLHQQTGIEFGRTTHGSIRVFRSKSTLQRAIAAADRLSAEGIRFSALSPAETVDINPALSGIKDQLTGALHYESDESGDAYRFCIELAERARQLGVDFRFGTEVSELERGRGGIEAVRSGTERFVADLYVIAAGSYSTPLLRRARIRLPVRPAKGYSVTFAHAPRQALRVPVIDDDFHAAIVPLQDAIRVAGTAEFAGYDLALRSGRIHNLVRLLQNVLPQESFDSSAARSWCGLRPMSADGVPIIGPTPVPNLFVNTGHGHLGWTLAAGSARLLSDLLTQRAPGLDPAPFALERFRTSGAMGLA